MIEYLLKIFAVFIILFSLIGCDYGTNDKLFVAAREGNVEQVEYLLKNGANVNHRFQYLQKDFQPYETPIIAAAQNGYLDVVKILIRNKAQIDTTNSHNERNAIYYAVMNKHRKIVNYLLDKGANPMSKQSLGKNLLMMAIEQDNLNLIKYLVRYGAWPDPEEKDAQDVAGSVGKNAIELAIALKRPYINYLKQQQVYCKKIFKSRISCKRF